MSLKGSLEKKVSDNCEQTNRKSASYRFAYWLSWIFHTPVMTLCVFLVFLTKVTIGLKILSLIIVGNFLVPLFYLIYAYKTKKITDLDVSK